jgi:hypothetical protein
MFLIMTGGQVGSGGGWEHWVGSIALFIQMIQPTFQDDLAMIRARKNENQI